MESPPTWYLCKLVGWCKVLVLMAGILLLGACAGESEVAVAEPAVTELAEATTADVEPTDTEQAATEPTTTEPYPTEAEAIPMTKSTIYSLSTDQLIQSLPPGQAFEGRPGQTTINNSPYLAISTEWGGDVDLHIGTHASDQRYLHHPHRTDMFILRLNHAAIQFKPGDEITFSGRWGEPFFDLKDTWFSVIIAAYGSQHDVMIMGQNYSTDMPADGTFTITSTLTQEMIDNNLNPGPPHSGVRLYIWTSGEDVSDYPLFIDEVTVRRYQ